MTHDREQIAIAATLAALALASLFLSRRSPSYRPLSASLLLLAWIDVARLVTAPHAALREWGWWQADVCLCALWPVAIGVGLLRKPPEERFGQPAHRAQFHVPPDVIPSDLAERASTQVHYRDLPPEGIIAPSAWHAHILSRLASLCSLAILLGALRPHLPRVVYLTGLRLPRWALAGLWVEVVLGVWVSLKSDGLGNRSIRARSAGLTPASDVPPAQTGASTSLFGAGSRLALRPSYDAPLPEDERLMSRQSSNERDNAQAPALACSLILAACNTADLVAGAWLVAPWQPPAWQYARAVTWAAYAGVGVVMGWEVVRRARAR